MPIAIPDFGFFKKGKALAKELKKAPAGESKKASALRVELDAMSRMLMWVCSRIDEYNDDAERPLCPSQKAQCTVGANCRGCWLRAAMSEADRG
jgi:hypothetical protein